MGEELALKCTLNTYKAPVKWFKEKKEISSDDTRFDIDKDIIGVCTLKIKNPVKDDAGKYSCKIVGREKEKNCFTKTEVVIKGIDNKKHGKIFNNHYFLRSTFCYCTFRWVKIFLSISHLFHTFSITK